MAASWVKFIIFDQFFMVVIFPVRIWILRLPKLNCTQKILETNYVIDMAIDKISWPFFMTAPFYFCV